MMSEAQEAVFAKRSELGKVAVPTDHSLVPPDLLEAMQQLVETGMFKWIDRYFNLDLHLECDVYRITPAGRAALEE